MRSGEGIPLALAGQWLSGGTPSTSCPEYWEGDIPWITSSSMKEFNIHDSERKVTPAGVENGTRMVPPGTIMFVVRGMSLKKEFRVGVTTRAVTFGQDCKAIIPSNRFVPRYLAHALRAQAGHILTLVDEASHGTGRLRTDAMEALVIPAPPLPEQRRIADILDRADAVRQKRRESIRLTREFLRSTFLEMFGDPVTNPKGWPTCRVEAAGNVQVGRQRTPKYLEGRCPAPYLRVANVFEDRIDVSDVLEMDFDEGERERFRLKDGDILLNEGQSTELVGRPAIWRSELPFCCFQNSLIRFQGRRDLVLPEYALEVFITYLHKGVFARASSKTSNMAHLSGGRFGALPFPVPPIQMQQQWAHFRGRLVAMRQRCQDALERAEWMVDALVQQAFQGELGSGDAPAEVVATTPRIVSGSATKAPPPIDAQQPPPAAGEATPASPADNQLDLWAEPASSHRTDTPGPVGALRDAVLALLRQNPGNLFAKADLVAQVPGLDEGRWVTVSKQLAGHPEVAKTGEKRATRYQLRSVELDTPAESPSDTESRAQILDEPSRRVLAWLDKHLGWHTTEAVLAGAGLDTSLWSLSRRLLLESGLVEKEGMGRGTRYRRFERMADAD